MIYHMFAHHDIYSLTFTTLCLRPSVYFQGAFSNQNRENEEMVENDKASTRFYEKITLRDFLPVLTLALGYFYGVSSSARETLSLQNTVPYSPALPRAMPACPLVCPTGPAGPKSIGQHQLDEIQGPDEILPIVTKGAGTLKLKGWDRKIPEAYGRVEELYEKKSCECSWGGKFNFTELANQTHLPLHKMDLELWKRDNYFDQSKPPPTFAKSHLPVSYITSGYEIDPTESVKLQIFVSGDPIKFVTGNFSCNFGEISWPETGKTTVGRMNDALEVFAVYRPTTYDARNDSKLVNIALL